MQEKSIRLGIVVAEFNYDITQLMLQKALSHARFLNVEVKVVIKVPGTFDMPLAIKKLLEKDFIDAVVTLGAVIKGETKHDELVASQTARKIVDLSTEFNKPVTLGIIGHGATHEQAVERIEEYATRAVEAAIKLVQRTRKLDELKEIKETVIIE
ncbi:6,7-dimethyl-8-ribityllumazine synthase [Saccharolobus solfataricus]|uniref:6,7-dimethyl-8-ribityllumazine synthase n=3 Tax=Saccharolobus solfataricus TaxID=2287 RepID=RISB_SACS2|nr:6,7-dimethyl-8-ribityllumazine synthase [Saccharolobus solfataricus]Q980B5.1 RecName: Full=6,7-dimethyl-8-ribityllumazine synthase; Short=DMRL synthase; Short=LS; Short=Lumazine synthase [Saccharolobus solfataricus P2]AAK40729.1 Riboflavin synthase beta chain (6,7 dimethyl 8-ribityllumazine synthase) (DMRKL synthase) (ribH) [Saccharolobus solfataricus P2]AKA73706.1 6,7-dimethyl-8-ribityllumazine synthase [Saccharolobus solfataricus]AKA76403.1 6,7-dimethyl-8-ribityllumazine synthase [Saccharo